MGPKQLLRAIIGGWTRFTLAAVCMSMDINRMIGILATWSWHFYYEAANQGR